MMHKLYRVDKSVDLMRVDNVRFENLRTENRPMNSNIVKLHRGIDNQIRFRVFNQDRKPVNLHDLEVIARLVNPQNGETVLIKQLTVSSKPGYVHMYVSEGEITNIPPGFYNMVVLGQEDLVAGVDGSEVYRSPFYTDIGNNIVCSVQVTESALPLPAPSYVITNDDWRVVKQPIGFLQDIDELRTSAIPANRVRNHINALHTMGVFTTDFTGTLQVYATLDLQPPEDIRRWFPVDLTSGTNIIEFDRYTGSVSFAFAANFMWLTFVQRPNVLPADSPLGSRVVPRFSEISNRGGFFDAAKIIRLNTPFLKEELRVWVDREFPSLMTPQQAALCSRDVELVIAGIEDDLKNGGFSGTLASAEAYYNKGDPVLPTGQSSPTAKTYDKLGDLISKVITNIKITQPLQDPTLVRFENIVNGGGYSNAATLTRDNRSFLKAEMKSFAAKEFPGLMNLEQAALCDRDVGLVVNLLADDLQLGGFKGIKDAADVYFNLGNFILPPNQNSPTAQTYTKLAEHTKKVINNEIVISTFQDPISAFFTGVNNEGGYNNESALLLANKEFLQAEVKEFVEQNFPSLMTPEQAELCDRDVGFIIEALGSDLVDGGFAESKLAAEFYFNGGYPVLPSGQSSPTAQSYLYLLGLVKQVISNQVITPTQQDESQVFIGDQTFEVTNIGAGAYDIDGQANPTLNLERGKTYIFNINALGHPFWIKTSQTTGTGDAFNDGVFNNGTQDGTIVFTVPANAPSTLFYICQFHGSMTGTISITGSGTPPNFDEVNRVLDKLVAGLNGVIIDPPVEDENQDVVAPFFATVQNSGDSDASQLLSLNRDFFKAELRKYVRQEFPTLMTAPQAALCDRDVGFIVDALVDDLENGGFAKSKEAAEAYYNNGFPVLPAIQNSPTAKTYDELVAIAKEIIRNNLITDQYQDPITGFFAAVTNAGNHSGASQLITLNKSFLVAEFSQSLTNTGLFSAPQITTISAEADVVIDAIIDDLNGGSFDNVRDRAVVNFNLGDPLIPSGQRASVADAYEMIVSRIEDIIRNEAVQSPLQSGVTQQIDGSIQVSNVNAVDRAVSNLLTVYNEVLLFPPGTNPNRNLVEDYFTAVNNDITSATSEYNAASTLLEINRDFIKAELKEFVDDVFPNLMTPEQSDLCNRDVGFIVDGFVQDLRDGGFAGTLASAEAYYNDGDLILPSGQKSPTAQTYLELVRIAKKIIRNQEVTKRQTSVTQKFNTSLVVGNAANDIDLSLDDLVSALNAVIVDPPIFYIAQTIDNSLNVTDLSAVDNALDDLVGAINAVIKNPPQKFVAQSLNTNLVVAELATVRGVIDALISALNSVIIDPPNFVKQVIDSSIFVEDRSTVNSIVRSLIAALNSVIIDPPPFDGKPGRIDRIILR